MAFTMAYDMNLPTQAKKAAKPAAPRAPARRKTVSAKDQAQALFDLPASQPGTETAPDPTKQD